MRKNGVADFPDPDSSGRLMLPDDADPNNATFRAANQACQALLPGGGAAKVTSPDNLARLAKFAKCMTQHGVPMSAGSSGQISFGSDVDPNSPQFQQAQQACKQYAPGGIGG